MYVCAGSLHTGHAACIEEDAFNTRHTKTTCAPRLVCSREAYVGSCGAVNSRSLRIYTVAVNVTCMQHAQLPNVLLFDIHFTLSVAEGIVPRAVT